MPPSVPFRRDRRLHGVGISGLFFPRVLAVEAALRAAMTASACRARVMAALGGLDEVMVVAAAGYVNLRPGVLEPVAQGDEAC